MVLAVMFLKESSNNRADTMFQAFEQGVTEFGLPLRIRMDKGGKNVEVARCIVEERGAGHAIVGRSVHNQRIERLWRDFFSGCISFFYHSFYFLEDCGLLDILDERDIYAVHFSLLGMIQYQLNSFMLGWSNCGLRTEHRKSLMQLWVSGLLQTRTVNPEHEALSGLHEVGVNLCFSHIHFNYTLLYFYYPHQQSETYGIDVDGLVPLNGDQTVVVENIDNILSSEQKHMLRQELDQIDCNFQEGIVSMLSLAKAYICDCR